MPVSKNALLRAVRDYRATEPKIRFYEPQDVKPKILANAIKQCCPDIPEKDVIALLDENYPRRGKCCLVLTLDTLYLSSGHLVRGNSSKRWVRISDIVSTILEKSELIPNRECVRIFCLYQRYCILTKKAQGMVILWALTPLFYIVI